MAFYFVADIRIHDPEEYQKYLHKAGEIFSRYKGEYLAVDNHPELLEGSMNWGRAVIIRFPSKENFEAWYHSDEYRRILAHRLKAADCNSILVQGK